LRFAAASPAGIDHTKSQAPNWLSPYIEFHALTSLWYKAVDPQSSGLTAQWLVGGTRIACGLAAGTDKLARVRVGLAL